MLQLVFGPPEGMHDAQGAGASVMAHSGDAATGGQETAKKGAVGAVVVLLLLLTTYLVLLHCLVI